MSKLHPRHVRPGALASSNPNRRLQPLALLVGLAVAQWAATSARADSGSGADTISANALNPASLSSARDKDPDGLGEASHSRSPTGFMYPYPWVIRTPNKSESGWLSNASVEVGGLAVMGDKEASKFREYKDLKTGAYLNNFSVQAEKPADAYYVDVYGGGLGRDDQYLSLTTGRYNDWKVKAFFNKTPHVFTATYRDLWTGTGSSTLTLKPPLTAGPVLTSVPPSTADAAARTLIAAENTVRSAVANLSDSTLGLIRQKGGLRLDLTLPGDWKFFAGYSNEHREGSRPFGMIFGGGGGAGSVEIPESIDYNTIDFLTGVNWGTARTSLNLQVSASLFRNHITTETIDNPWPVAVPNTAANLAAGAQMTGITSYPQGQFALYPNNDAYTVKAEAAHAIPEFAHARFTGVFLATSTRQNDALIASVPQTGAIVNGIAGGSWDTPDSLWKKNAGAKIDSKLLDLGLAFNPVAGLDVKGKLRHYETSNSTEYWACNPLTGQWGRLINNGGSVVFASPATTVDNPVGTTINGYNGAGCDINAVKALNGGHGLVPNAGNINIRNIPYEYKQDNYSVGADYRIANSQNLNLSFEREEFKRQHRERDKTWEDKIKIGYVNRALAGGTLRASFEDARRRGSTYNSDPYEEFYSASFADRTPTVGNIVSWIHVQPLHRKFDLADRDTSILNLRFNHALTEELDLGAALQLKASKYPSSQYGRRGTWSQNSFNADINWQPSPEVSVYGYLTQQTGHITQAGDQTNACTIGTTYYFLRDATGNVAISNAAPTPAQTLAGVTVVSTSTPNSTPGSASNWTTLCESGPSDANPLFNSSRVWTVTQNDSNTTFGLGSKLDLGKAKLDLNYGFSYGRTKFSYTYNPYGLGILTIGTPTGAQNVIASLIGDGLPTQVIQTDQFDASLLVPLGKSAAVRFLLREEIGKYRDPHYDGVAANRIPYATANPGAFLDAGPQDYKVTSVGVLLQYNW
jgi:hypothetical protein